MDSSNIDILESLKIAFFTTISVVTPLLVLYIVSERGIISMNFDISFSLPIIVLGVFILFNLAFSISVLDQWRD